MRFVEDVIARQVASYEQRRQLQNAEQRPGRGAVGTARYGPYLLISRARGSGGHTVADLVGARLGWPVFDREIVDEIAQQSKVRRDLIESLDERGRSVIEEILMPAFQHGDIGEGGYLRYLKQVVLALGQQGDVIIVGRGARYILPGQFGLRVRLVAPFDTRAQRIAAEDQVPLQEAQPRLHRADDEQATFVHHHFHGEAGDPLSHDLIINTDKLSSEAVATIIVAALGQKLGVKLSGPAT